jgi:hypothetical protein
LVEPAQKFEFEVQMVKAKPKAKRSLIAGNIAADAEEPKKLSDDTVKSQDSLKSDDDIFTQQIAIDDLDEVIQSSQPADSPSIFEPYGKRMSQQSPRAKRKVKKSKFSIDTMDILADISP